MELLDFLENDRVCIWKEIFAVVKSRRIYPDAFANIIDKREITVVIEQTKVDEKDVINIERDWKILSFDMLLPFGLIGFLATISKAFADQGISICVISAYSTDHILVKEKDVPKARKKLEQIGFNVIGYQVSVFP